MHRLHISLAEPPVNPPEPQLNPQITRANYQYHSPRERAEVADELLTTLEECARSIDFLNESDPEAGEGFPGAKMVLVALANKVREHREEKIEPWL